ncbi:unnamed protein product [Callosobruchus maculatus]|uniref:Uncharacterized protein n=1 Tax=Callosobruchus maculatus TaxID=64391 RepID=A0A653CJB5_CALMS|nr:unnamed protein product [Callosobruchus maculatus]
MIRGELPVPRWFMEYIEGMDLEIINDWDRGMLELVLENANAAD